MSALSDIVAQLESGGGANVASQPASMVNPTYGQYSGFVTQYGNGASGVDNYAQSVLAANPNATLGDYYSGYVLDTGSGVTPGVNALAAEQPGAYRNLVNNAGVSLDTPLASLLGPGSGIGDSSVVDTSSGAAAGLGSGYVPGVTDASFLGDMGSSLPYMFGPLGGALKYLTEPSGSVATAPGPNENIGLTPGLTNSVTGWLTNNITNPLKAATQGALSSAENWVGRGFLIVVGVVVLGVALFALLAKTDAAKVVERAAP